MFDAAHDDPIERLQAVERHDLRAIGLLDQRRYHEWRRHRWWMLGDGPSFLRQRKDTGASAVAVGERMTAWFELALTIDPADPT